MPAIIAETRFPEPAYQQHGHPCITRKYMAREGMRVLSFFVAWVLVTCGLIGQPIPKNAKICIDEMPNDLHVYIKAEIIKKRVPVRVVDSLEDAEYEMRGTEQFRDAKWHEGWLTAEGEKTHAAIEVVDREGVLVWANEAGDRDLWWGNWTRKGHRKVADRLVKKFKKAVQKHDTTKSKIEEWWPSTKDRKTQRPTAADSSAAAGETPTIDLPKATTPGSRAGVTTFRDTRWGMTRDDVMMAEGKDVYFSESKYFAYHRNVIGLDVSVAYYFEGDRLVKARYVFEEKYGAANDYIADFQTAKGKLSEKYGKPTEDSRVWTNQQFRDDLSKLGEALKLRHVTLVARWTSPETKIVANLFAMDDGEIRFIVEYSQLKVVSNDF